MEDSILTSTKKILGLDAAYEAFDLDVITHINSILMVLNQLGVGENGFMIEDATSKWGDFLGDNEAQFNIVRSYVFLRVRLLFDPPTTSYLIGAYKEQIQEMEWRLSVAREDTDWVDPNIPA